MQLPMERLQSVAISPDGRRLVVVPWEGGVIAVLDVKQCRILRSWQSGKVCLLHVAFTPDGSLFATAGNGPIVLWDALDWKGRAQFGVQDTWIFRVAFTRDGRFVLTGNSSGLLQLWKMPGPPPDK